MGEPIVSFGHRGGEEREECFGIIGGEDIDELINLGAIVGEGLDESGLVCGHDVGAHGRVGGSEAGGGAEAG